MEETEALPLRDIHLPDPISWWPPAPGWWALIGLFVLLMVSVRIYFMIKQRRQVRVAALNALHQISADFESKRNAQQLVKDLSILLRRICLSYFPRADVAGLTGEKWLTFLDGCLDWQNISDRFSQGSGRALITAPYQKSSEVDGDKLLSLCGVWIKALPLLKVAKS